LWFALRSLNLVMHDLRIPLSLINTAISSFIPSRSTLPKLPSLVRSSFFQVRSLSSGVLLRWLFYEPFLLKVRITIR
jgi:hypothetical protein